MSKIIIVRNKGCSICGKPVPTSPWFCVFDHWAPHDPRKIVITSALINGMKTDLAEEEFWWFVNALANFKRHQIPLRSRKRWPVCWNRRYPIEEELKGYESM